MTASSFARAAPMGAALYAVALASSDAHASARGVALAMASGALASGAGYSVWYAALRHLSATRAAALQLLVPVLSAAGAAALLGESITTRLVGASVAILGGVALTIRASVAARRTPAAPPPR